MFIDRLVERNPQLVRAAVELHQAGELPSSTYIIDLDALHENARALCGEAERLGLTVVGMTKQFGRNPVAIEMLERAGVDRFVAVDVMCARAISHAGGAVGHVGHLVQIPRAQAIEIAAMKPEHWTVFDLKKASEAGEAAAAVGRRQDLLARIFGANDIVFESHAGGFSAEEIEHTAEELAAVPGCGFAGVTSYPALVFDRKRQRVEPTSNLETLAKAASVLEKRGYGRVAVNAPGVTSTSVLQLLADGGATHVEPGHGFTGTTPLHAVMNLVERPAMAYVSEISHLAGGSAYCFGGGLYQCIDTLPGALHALVGGGPDEALRQRAVVHLTDYQVIDFYGRLTAEDGATLASGDTVVFCFRPQVFYTRAAVAPVSGIASETPRVEGLFDSQGRAL